MKKHFTSVIQLHTEAHENKIIFDTLKEEMIKRGFSTTIRVSQDYQLARGSYHFITTDLSITLDMICDLTQQATITALKNSKIETPKLHEHYNITVRKYGPALCKEVDHDITVTLRINQKVNRHKFLSRSS